jgi:hypothetical protein
MMSGCLTLTNSLSYSPLRASQLLALVLTLNAYELLLVGLGLYLIVRRGVRRDGMFLLLIEAAFLVDMAFLNAEVYSIRPALGLLVNLLVFSLAVVKLTAIFRVLHFSTRDGLLPFILAELFILFSIPGIFAQAALGHDGRLSPWLMYAAWSLLGMLPAAYIFVVRQRPLLTIRSGNLVRDVLTRVLVIVPIISIIVHLSTANWVYKLHFNLANIAPFLIGLGFAIGHYDNHLYTYARRVRAQLLLPALAVALSLSYPDTLVYVMTGPDWSPLRLALVAAGIVYLEGLRFHRHMIFAYAAAFCAIAFGMGPSVDDMQQNITVTAEHTQTWLERLTPRTGQQWGVLSVITSFLLLGIGFIVSLLKPATVQISPDDTIRSD